MEQSLLGFRAANPSWQPSDPSASLFLSRLASMDPISPPPRSRGVAQQLHTTGRGHTATNNNNNVLSFTPANSTLAQRSQLYNDAFERSISLATKPSNALALQASAVKIGNRSVAAKTLQAVDEDLDMDQEEEVDEDLDPNSNSAYEDARPEVQKRQQQQQQNLTQSNETNEQESVNLRGLLEHIGSRW